jgi:ubiquinone/menaquinone biosynthesis C-methylase UbiE
VDDWREAIWRAVPEGAQPECFASRLAFLLGHVRAGERVLDLGCGDGAFAARLVDAGAEVTGADVSREALRRARERVPQAQLIHVTEGAVLPFAEDAFDAVWAGEVLEHVADVTGLLAEVRRVLRWGGRLIATTPFHGPATFAALALRPRAAADHFDPRSDHLRFFTARSLSAVLAETGFRDVELRAVGGLPLLRQGLYACAS